LSDAEFTLLLPMLPPAKPGGRPRTTELRTVLDGLFHVLRTGCQWRHLPAAYPPWQTVYGYWRAFIAAGVWDEMLHVLRMAAREAGGARGQPVGRHHRQPERQDDGKGGPRGWDAGKKVRGRKRHIVVDTLGFLLAVLAHPADIQDRPGAVSLLPRLQGVVSRLAILYADSGYAGPMVETACQALGGCHLITLAKDAAARGFHVLPKRWVVERTLAWLCRNRRLAKDYEHLPAVSEAFVKLAMIRLMTARLT